MNAKLLRRTVLASVVFAIIGAAVFALWDWRAAIVYFGACSWALGNIFVWAGLFRTLLVSGKRNSAALLKWISIKVGFLALGFVALFVGAPYTTLELTALILGVSCVLVSATLVATVNVLAAKEFGSVPSKNSASGSLTVLLLLTSILLGATPLTAARSEVALDRGRDYRSVQHVPPTGLAESQQSPVLLAQAHEAENAHGVATDASHSAGHEAEAHGSGEAGGHAPATPSLPNLVTILLGMKIGGVAIADTPLGHFLHTYEYQIFLVFITIFLCLLIWLTKGLRALLPGPVQAASELIVEGFLNFTASILGSREQARKHFPFVGSLFIFIWANNMFGIVPLFTGATSMFTTTAPLALIVFFYVHYFAIREGGVKHWLLHLMGNPDSVVGWALAPFLFILEVIGELAKPLSLSLRLYGNIMGEHILSGVFLILGIAFMGAVWAHPWVGLPLHLPFLFLSLLVGTIQALVFTLLATIYLALLLPHEHHEAHEPDHGAGEPATAGGAHH
ncbi:MAG: hypothetical protein KatS3mg130_1263 [Candidatus Sumerlaea sp.]|nr:MAG: hypothetical protein KatS3mg130_1263 [Candidatus Sumerlaea sp.]